MVMRLTDLVGWYVLVVRVRSRDVRLCDHHCDVDQCLRWPDVDLLRVPCHG